VRAAPRGGRPPMKKARPVPRLTRCRGDDRAKRMVFTIDRVRGC
jgi:hypothetical protein